MPRLTDAMHAALRALRTRAATSPETAVEAGAAFGANLWNRLYSAGLAGRTGPSGARLWWITREGEAALAAHEGRAPDQPGDPE